MLITTEDRLLLFQRRAVPELHVELNNPHRLIAAAHRPCRFILVGSDPHHLLHERAIVAVRVGRAVLEAQQVHRGLFSLAAGGVIRDKTFPLPAHAQQIRRVLDDVAQGVDHRVLGVGADLQEQVAVTKGGIQGIIREARHFLQRFRLLFCQPVARVKQRFSQRNGYGQVIRGNEWPQNAGVHWRQTRVRRIGRRSTGGKKRDARRQQAEQTFQIGFITGQRIKGHQHHRRLLRRQDTGLMLAIKRLRLHAGIR